MKRVESGGFVVYVHRRRWISLLFFAAAVGVALYGAFSECPGGPDHRHWIPTLLYGALLSTAAVAFLLEEHAFVVDPRAGTLRVVHRGLFGRVRFRRLAALRDVGVRTTSAETTLPLAETPVGSVYWIWLEMPGAGRLLFEGPLKNREALRARVERLTADLKGRAGSGSA